ncbi:MAG: haloacid dehalogenase type II [Wenzhouxiangellaceae bacterium]|nr:haloacid dehalogenase type II [Wenzhouxiangellaceae bacterium]
MRLAIAFDVYGTLIDTHGVFDALEELIGARAEAFARSWRDKQLEYSFRRGLMQRYQPFSVCTGQALEYCCDVYDVDLDAGQKQRLMEVYRRLPAFADVGSALDTLTRAGHRLFAFSNGTREAVDELLERAGIAHAFEDVVSCDEIRSFKPDPAAYAHFIRRAGVSADMAWLISGNAFDIIGARAAGLHAAWVRRPDNAVFDPWDIEPDCTIRGLDELAEVLA